MTTPKQHQQWVLRHRIGLLVRRRPKALGWTQVDLARRTGLRQNVISAVELGEGLPRADTLLALIVPLGVGIEQLVTVASPNDGNGEAA